MKRVNIPIFQQHICIYKADEKEKFEKKAGKLPDEYYACHSNDCVWIGESKNVSMQGACFHEAVHFVDWLLEHRLDIKLNGPIWDHTELRAYMVQYIGEKIMEYCCE